MIEPVEKIPKTQKRIITVDFTGVPSTIKYARVPMELKVLTQWVNWKVEDRKKLARNPVDRRVSKLRRSPHVVDVFQCSRTQPGRLARWDRVRFLR